MNWNKKKSTLQNKKVSFPRLCVDYTAKVSPAQNDGVTGSHSFDFLCDAGAQFERSAVVKLVATVKKS